MTGMKSVVNVLCSGACTVVLLAGCTFEPHEYPTLAPPRAAQIVPLFKSDPVVALVLGAGGARGFAHIGVIKVLETAGIQPAVVVGSSSGAIVAALYAGGLDAAALERMALDVKDYQLIDFTLFGPSRIQGEALQDFVNRALSPSLRPSAPATA
jgi:NTE family protein